MKPCQFGDYEEQDEMLRTCWT